MRLNRLWLTDIRCYTSAELAPAEGLTAIIGDNGRGKTSLLEAVAWLATGRSFRSAPDAAVVREGADRGYIRAEIERGGRAALIEAEVVRQGRNRVQVNRQAISRKAALAEAFLVTLFSPDDLELVKGGPAVRRGYLDDVATAVVPGAGAVLGEYERVVRQRTSLLRSGLRTDDDRHTLSVWDDQLVSKGALVVDARRQVIDRLEGALAKAYGDLAVGAARNPVVAGAYETDWGPSPDMREGDPDIAGLLRAAIEQHRRREIDRGQTLVGPHRDEWRLSVAGLDARTHASQGEQRTLALALRLAAHGVLTDHAGEPPVLLLDDVFSELDPGRADALVSLLAPGESGQALITTASALPESLAVELRVRVGDGTLAHG